MKIKSENIVKRVIIKTKPRELNIRKNIEKII